MESKLYSLSNPQKSIWLTEQFHENTNVNNVSGYLIINEKVNLDILEQAVNSYIRANDAVRIRIKIDEDGTPMQYVKPYKFYSISQTPLKDENEFINWNNSIIQEPFSLIDSDLFSFHFFYLPDGRGGFNVIFHHIITDAWSISLLISEITNNYAKLTGRFEDLNYDINYTSPSYIDFLSSEQDYLSSNKYEKDKEFWENVFDDVPELCNITTKKMNSKSLEATRQSFILDKKLYKEIYEFCKSYRGSIYTFFATVYSLYLARLNNTTSSIIGTPVLNRSNFKEKHTGGMFISTIPLKITIPENSTFEELFRNVSSSQMAVFRHQKYPYSKLLEDLKKKYNFTENLYDVALSYQNARDNKEESKVNFDSQWLFTGHSNDTLQIHFYDMDNTGEMNIYYDYQIEKLSLEEIKTLHQRILHIVSQVLENPTMDLNKIEIITPAEKNLLLNRFTKNTIIYPKEKSIIQLLEEKIEEVPNSRAVYDFSKSMTYQDLGISINKLAGTLQSLGIKKGDIIATFLPRTCNLIVSMLAIMKCGAIYLPISTTLPVERVNYILKDSNAKAIITNSLVDLKNMQTPKTQVFLDDFACQKSNIIEKAITPVDYSPSDIIYTIYTSGSTGNPKGVQITNENLNNFIRSFNKYFNYQISENDVCLSSTSISFDVSIWEFFFTLLNGATLCLYPEDSISDIFDYCENIIKNNITMLYIPPNILENVYDILSKKGSTSLNKILIGVEPVRFSTMEKYFSLNPNMQIVNGYGPTETTICCTAYVLDKNNLLSNNGIIPIGTPLYNENAYLVDKNLNLVPDGSIGELLISGDGVSFGYLGKNDLTSQKYITSPFRKNEVLYRTGDLVKYVDGNFMFVGRNDNQYKIRGHRIELGEVENAITSYPGIEKCVISLRNNHKFMVAFFIAEEEISIQELKQFLLAKLPFYSVPNFFMQLDKFPLTSNGKIDKRKLDSMEIDLSANYVAPKNKMQEKLASIWEELLNVHPIGIEDSFFDIGGDSLACIKLVSEIYSNFEIKLTVKDIFDYNTIAKLSTYMQSHEKYINTENVIMKVADCESYPLTSPQKGIYLTVSLEEQSSISYNMPYGIWIDGNLSITKLEKSIQTLIQRHNAFRTYFVMENHELVQKIKDSIPFSLEVEKYSQDSYTSKEVEKHSQDSNTSEEVKKHSQDSNTSNQNISSLLNIFNEFVRPFNLETAPLFRIKLIQFSDTHYLLLLDIHHIICDGISVTIFLEELSKLYQGKTLPANTLDYKDYAVFENKQKDSFNYQKMKEYWLNQFKGDLPSLNMPTNYLKSSSPSFIGQSLFATIPNKQEILDFCNKHHTTPYIFLLSVYYIALYYYTSQEDIIVGTAVAGRKDTALKNMIGMFVNTLAIRQTVSTKSSFVDFLNSLTEKCLLAFENELYSFDELVKDLNLNRDSNRNPLFDTMFVYQNDGESLPKLPNLKLSPCYFPQSISKFDFSMELYPKGENFEARLEFRTDLFTSTFMEQFLNDYINLIKNFLKNETIFLSEVSIANQKKIEDLFNNTYLPYDETPSLVELFEKQVKTNPKKTAICFKDCSISYENLNKKANQIAHYLVKNNVKANQVIGILLPRTPDLLYAMFGILKSGAGYMLIDPTLPHNRIAFMLENAKCPFLITTHESEPIESISKIYIEDFQYEKYSEENYPSSSNNEDIFSVIYTSGSTGIPKGVALKRKGVINLLHCYEKFLYTTTCENFLSMSSIAFDMFIVENFVSLLAGKTVILTNEEEQKIPVYTNNLIEKQKVNFILTTPSRMDLLLSNIQNPDSWKTVKVIQLGGEVFPANLYEKIKTFAPNAHVFNGYGPTEITACCTSKEVTSSTDISIGKPFGNTQIWICDKDLHLCPIGVEGEICVGGYGVAKEYINNPELTSKSFVPNPFGDGFIYKTGDIAKYKENGDIDYIGRRDFQIKIRGLRVELSEIEKQFLKIPQIKNVTVLYKKEENPYLVAFYTTSEPIETKEIRKTLSTCLPLYMVPKYLILLSELPITPNGKVDKKKLENYNINQTENTSYVAPVTDLEKLLCSVWETLLHTKIGIDNDIFEMGADSLLAIKFKTELLSYNINIPYADIFKYKTIRELASAQESTQISTTNTLSQYDFSNCQYVLDKNMAKYFSQSLPKQKNCTNNSILLLGANGFVGSHILYEFIKNDKGKAYCIVRDKNNETAKTRFLKVLHFYFGNELDSYLDTRIILIKANILKPYLGLPFDDFEKLMKNIDVVINTASMVKHYGSTEDFKKVNVDFTKSLVELCIQKKKRLLHISSLSVSGNLSLDGDFSSRTTYSEDMNFAENQLFIGQDLNNEYIKSKFIAEKLILDAIYKENLKAQILRLGNITNRYKDGAFQINYKENAFLNRILTFIKIGCVPENLSNIYIEFTPADICAKAIISILQHYVEDFSVYHLYDDSHVYMNQFLGALEEEGIIINIISKDEFSKHIAKISKNKSSSASLSGIINDLSPKNELDYKSNIKITSDFTKAFLYHNDFTWPTIDNNYLKKYIQYLKNNKLI